MAVSLYIRYNPGKEIELEEEGEKKFVTQFSKSGILGCLLIDIVPLAVGILAAFQLLGYKLPSNVSEIRNPILSIGIGTIVSAVLSAIDSKLLNKAYTPHDSVETQK